MGWGESALRWWSRQRTSPPVEGGVGAAFEQRPERFEEPAPGQQGNELESMLAEIESASLAIYRAEGLPIRPGHYVRAPRGSRWRFIGSGLSPQDRWSMAVDKVGSGARFAVLADIGRDHPLQDVQTASRLLNRCQRLRARARSQVSSTFIQDLGAALILGTEWQKAKQGLVLRNHSRLKLLPPQGRR